VTKKDFIEECRQSFLANPRPRKLGKFYCFWYNEENQPRIVLGPDWIFSLIELIIINGVVGYFLYASDKKEHPYLFLVGFVTLLV
jgi:hypothetical protein